MVCFLLDILPDSLLVVVKGLRKAWTAAVSASSFPCITVWLGTQYTRGVQSLLSANCRMFSRRSVLSVGNLLASD